MTFTGLLFGRLYAAETLALLPFLKVLVGEFPLSRRFGRYALLLPENPVDPLDERSFVAALVVRVRIVAVRSEDFAKPAFRLRRLASRNGDNEEVGGGDSELGGLEERRQFSL